MSFEYPVALVRSAAAALRPGAGAWAVGPALRAVLSVGLIMLVAVLLGDLQAVGMALLGALCSVSFVTVSFRRARGWALASQAFGGAIGVGCGAALPPTATSLVLTAAVAGVVSGVVGATGPHGPGFGLILTVGVAFGQFGGSTLPWWQQMLWYLAGAAIVAAVSLAPSRNEASARQAVAAVFTGAAELCAAIGTESAQPVRTRMAAISARSRSVGGHRQADLVAYAAATLYAQGTAVPAAAIEAIRTAAAQLRAGEPVAVTFSYDSANAGLAELADALSGTPERPAAAPTPARRLSAIARAATTRTARTNGVRIGLCMAVATAVTVTLHEPVHSFWLPLTTAVVVRPEYASVFVRTVNRVVGTLVGAVAASAILLVAPSGPALAVAATLAVGFIVLAAPKLYALSVIGITASAILSQSIAHPDSLAPGLRVLDTLLGAAVALVFGYLLWPGARRRPGVARLTAALSAAHTYLGEAAKPASGRQHWQARRDDAYRLAHQARAGAEADLLEPPPVSAIAPRVIGLAVQVEDTVDEITAVASTVDAGGDPAGLAGQVRTRLARLVSQTAALAVRS